jgi:hypothetical protein
MVAILEPVIVDTSLTVGSMSVTVGDIHGFGVLIGPDLPRHSATSTDPGISYPSPFWAAALTSPLF